MTTIPDITIIGAGILGLTTTWQLLEREPDLKVVVLDKEDRIAQHQTGHNSGVIHSGIYYPPGSAKAHLCREGARRLVQFARQEGVAFQLCGKLIVASTEDEVSRLHQLQERGAQNGLDGLLWLSPNEARRIEPQVQCLAALHVPQTGIIHYPAVAEKALCAPSRSRCDLSIWRSRPENQ